jgi:hypothetical protein
MNMQYIIITTMINLNLKPQNLSIYLCIVYAPIFWCNCLTLGLRLMLY